MRGMAAKPMRIARHVYLRTQQRRLRHVKGIFLRNLTLSAAIHGDPLHVSVYFTIHSLHSPNRVLFRSEPLEESYNPSWESIQLSSQLLGHHASIPSFVLCVWVKCGKEEGEEHVVVFKKIVELFDLSYLGSVVNKDGSGYPPNSVVVNMYEGYYSHPEVGGVPCPPKIVHALTDFLPPQSLLEVQKKEVIDSYHQPELVRLLNQQVVLNGVRHDAERERGRVEQCRQLERQFFEKRSEKERLVTRLKLLRAQLHDMEEPEEEEKEQLERVTNEMDEKERNLKLKQRELNDKWERFRTALENFTKKRDQMYKCKRNKQLRQHHMIYELSKTFVIKERDETYTICNVILPNADQLEQPSSVEQLGVALGYVAHLLHQLGRAMFIPLLYPIKPQGSKSAICDLISEETLIDNIKEFPLFAKGSEKALFQYAVFLLNKDIAQVRQHCGYGTSKSMFKKTLPNLKFLMDRLTRDISTLLEGKQSSFQPPIAMDVVSMTSSYVSVDASSIASSSVASSLQSPGPESYHHLPSMSFNADSSPQNSHYPNALMQDFRFTHHNGHRSPHANPQLNKYRDSPYSRSQSDSSQELEREESLEVAEEALEEEEDEEDNGGREDVETPLVEQATDHTFTPPLSRSNRGVVDVQHPRSYFSTYRNPPSGDEGGWSDTTPAGEKSASSSSDPPSLSTTPVVMDGKTYPTLANFSHHLSHHQLDPSEEYEMVTSTDTSGHSSMAQVGSLEETLKSAVHVTQTLLGHSPPEHIQIEPTPVPCSDSEVAVESTKALLNQTTFSFTETEENVDANEVNSSEEPVPQGPTLIPDSIELSLLSHRRPHRSTEEIEDGQSFSSATHIPVSRSVAYTSYAMESGYIKTGMATPHIIEPSSRKQQALASTNYSSVMESSIGREDAQSLDDFIDGPSERFRPQRQWRVASRKSRESH